MDDCIVGFLKETSFTVFAEALLEISNTKDKNIRWDYRKDKKNLQIISFVYNQIMDFPQNKLSPIKTVITKTVITKTSGWCQKNILFNSHVIHHLHVSGKIIGYAHDFCNKNIREIQNPIPVFAHNLFSFDFFLVVKGTELCVWPIKQLLLILADQI